MNALWKKNWPEAREHFLAWWDHSGLVLGIWGTGLPKPGEPWVDEPAPPASANPRIKHTDPASVSLRIRAEMARKTWPADMLPLAWPDIGTVALAPFLGAIPDYGEDNVWYKPCFSDPDAVPALAFDPENPEVKILESVVRETVREARGNYFVGMPAYVPNLDVLAELRGTQDLLFDMLDRPDWIHEKLDEIDEVWKAAFDRMYEIVRLEDGSMAFGYFMLWGPKKTCLLQCDVSATFSPDMFGEFVLPRLEAECAWLDNSMYHLDGHQCLGHLDQVLSIEDLDAVEWTPDPQVPPGGDPEWFPMYRKILDAGKSVWIANVKPVQVKPLLDAVGGKGIYLTVDTGSEREFEDVAKIVNTYR
jgi:hypothetical protein